MTRALQVTLAALSLFVASMVAVGQVSPEEHAEHHPGAAASGSQPDGRSLAIPGAGADTSGMMEGMGEMMEGMGGAPPKALYPSLMDFPDLSPEKRDEVLRAAHERMVSGADLMGEALDQLARATPTSDYAAMQSAIAMLREGVARFDSGLAANRAIAEGKDPRHVAMQWFRGEMNLRTAPITTERSGLLDLSASHLLVMGLLVAFAAVMISMYFFKMRRAAALFGRIEAGKGPPPPGSAPPLTGAPGPSVRNAPPGSKTPPAGERNAPGGATPSAIDASATTDRVVEVD